LHRQGFVASQQDLGSHRDIQQLINGGQRVSAMKLRELAAVGGTTDYTAASIAIRPFERRLERGSVEREQLKQLCQMLNVAM
jgi:hypothetical protein